ncbi:ATP-binding protein [Phenylobacterium sp.]|uniref:ATP-binding protein n=1 Tax=Phenylobacterium sp. TaxID=1871053 RepID=UPI0035B4701A
MTLMAALAGAIWLDVRFCIGWFAANIVIMSVSKAFCAWIAERARPDGRGEMALALFTFGMTLVYCALPTALVLHGSQASIMAGMAMAGAVALSSVSEFVISRLVGGAALLAMFLNGVGALLWRAGDAPWAATVFAVAAMAGFFFYVVQTGLVREKTDRQMLDAMAAAKEAETAAALANQAKSAFLATMSHEIRTPLNGVLGMAQAMNADALTPAQRERLAVIRESGETLTAILNDVLDLAKIEAGQLLLETIAFELGDVLGASRAAFAAVAARKGLSLTLDIDEDAAGTYRGDPTRLRQVIHNLISNAVKFTETGAIVVRARRRDGWLDLSVSDTGIGVPADQLEKLFGKFVQLDASTTRRHGGTGLGLAICRDLCALMGGTIRVESTPGEGSTFTASLPFARVGAARDDRRADPAQAPTLASDELRVLAAEDNAVNQLVLRTLMKQAGIEPVTVDNGAEAVAAWESGDWDVILMDVHMPVMDGLAALREIRTREAASGRRRTPVIALTANAMVHQVAELRAAGMDAHVGKPIDVTQLFATIEQVLSPPQGEIPQAAGL